MNATAKVLHLPVRKQPQTKARRVTVMCVECHTPFRYVYSGMGAYRAKCRRKGCTSHKG